MRAVLVNFAAGFGVFTIAAAFVLQTLLGMAAVAAGVIALMHLL